MVPCYRHTELHPAPAGDTSTIEQRKARVLVEKKTVINLIEAFAVAVKHYLRGEEGVYYVDLYHLVKYLPAYALPAGLPSVVDLSSLDGASTRSPLRARGDSTAPPPDPELTQNDEPKSPSLTSPGFPSSPLPPPATATRGRKVSVQLPPGHRANFRARTFDKVEKSSTFSGVIGVTTSEDFLLPARNPPKYHLLDLFPFSLLVGFLTKRGKEVKVCARGRVQCFARSSRLQGKKAARIRAKLRSRVVTHNLPLEISLYLVRIMRAACKLQTTVDSIAQSSYIAALQDRGVVPPPTASE